MSEFTDRLKREVCATVRTRIGRTYPRADAPLAEYHEALVSAVVDGLSEFVHQHTDELMAIAAKFARGRDRDGH